MFPRVSSINKNYGKSRFVVVNCGVLRTNYILVDFENVQPKAIPNGKDLPIEVRIFMGENQKNIPVELTESLQALGDRVEYVKMVGSGPDALDFHIAYFIGKLAEQNPDSYFHIVSKDKGFDPLIRYLKNNKIFSQRVENIADILILNHRQHGTLHEKAETIAASLKSRKGGRPRKVKTLKNSINAFFLKSLKDSEIEKIVSILRSKKIVKVKEQNVSYQF